MDGPYIIDEVTIADSSSLNFDNSDANEFIVISKGGWRPGASSDQYVRLYVGGTQVDETIGRQATFASEKIGFSLIHFGSTTASSSVNVKIVQSSGDLYGPSIIVQKLATTTLAEGGGGTSSDIMYTGPNLQEWLFVAGVVIFFVSLMAWRYIFRPSKEIKDN